MTQTQDEPALRVTEIFFSLQGESTRVGLPTLFIRLTGCPLRCGYCDTDYAFNGGETLSVAKILEQAAQYNAHYVCVTGGEPLAQKHTPALLTALCNRHYAVSLETSGALNISAVDPRVSRIIDIKTPGSGETDKNHWDNLALITPHDEIKFVLCSEDDYRWAKHVIDEYDLSERCPVLLSPAHGQLDPAALADWVVRDQLRVRMQVQLHKYLWGNERGR